MEGGNKKKWRGEQVEVWGEQEEMEGGVSRSSQVLRCGTLYIKDS